MNYQSILLYRDRPNDTLLPLLGPGILVHEASTYSEARARFDELAYLDAIVVDVEESVERGLEFCEIVHVTRPTVPILFVRSEHRVNLIPHCAHRVLDPEIREDSLALAIFDLLGPLARPNRKQA